jgi:hypothetical protein
MKELKSARDVNAIKMERGKLCRNSKVRNAAKVRCKIMGALTKVKSKRGTKELDLKRMIFEYLRLWQREA